MHQVLHPCIIMVITAIITITRVMTTTGIQLLLPLRYISLRRNPDIVPHLHLGVHTAKTSQRKEGLLHQLLSLQLMITDLLPLLYHHIHRLLHLLVVLDMVTVHRVDPLPLPLLLYQSHLCPPFRLLIHILQVNVEQGQVLLQVKRQHEQILLGCHKWHQHLIHLMPSGYGAMFPVAGSFLSSRYSP